MPLREEHGEVIESETVEGPVLYSQGNSTCCASFEVSKPVGMTGHVRYGHGKIWRWMLVRMKRQIKVYHCFHDISCLLAGLHQAGKVQERVLPKLAYVVHPDKKSNLGSDTVAGSIWWQGWKSEGAGPTPSYDDQLVALGGPFGVHVGTLFGSIFETPSWPPAGEVSRSGETLWRNSKMQLWLPKLWFSLHFRPSRFRGLRQESILS